MVFIVVSAVVVVVVFVVITASGEKAKTGIGEGIVSDRRRRWR